MHKMLTAHNVACVDRTKLYSSQTTNIARPTPSPDWLTNFTVTRVREYYFGGQVTLVEHELWRFTADSDLLLMGPK